MKIQLSLLAIGLMSASMTTVAASLDEFLNGFYVGVGVARNWNDVEDKYKFYSDKVTDPSLYNQSKNFDANNYSPDILIGYGNYINDFFLGIEFNANFNRIEHKNHLPLTTYNKLTLDNAYSLSAKGGYNFFSNFLGYGLIGATRTKLQHHVIFNDESPYALLAPEDFDKSESVWGLLLGVGLEYAFNDCISIAAEYNHNFYNDIDYDIQHSIFTFLGDIGENKVKLSQNTLLLKIIYHL